ncbi:Uma2 family endonuclease [Cronbergia sp. UHCC 0137]|uniref:Uma2 family endonuclease n=1 Tax=Cronbergia sp. UHCC 0137 TaxID=3110239 RepID=UPI002B216ECD|nr:Uma2 family endonuclease [Cronbergia sp. UHCC 0137]MEA5619177.1 Uma2 family endonuclease [Cronbergia sp. UHCC 0137]
MMITLSRSGSKIYTAEEYLELEVRAEERHEYNDGEIIAMTGGTPNHNDIASNLMVILKSGLRGKPFRCFITDQRLWIPQLNKFTYPDVMVLSQPMQLMAGRTDTVINPLLIAEVLSLGTRSYDKDAKFAAYRSVASFQEYLLIDQYTVCVEHYAKTEDQQWIFREYKNLGDRMTLSTISLEMSLADLYENIQF